MAFFFFSHLPLSTPIQACYLVQGMQVAILSLESVAMRLVVMGAHQGTGISSTAKIPLLIAGTTRTPLPNQHRTPHWSPNRGTPTKDQAMWAMDGNLNVGTILTVQNAMDLKILGTTNANSMKQSLRPFLWLHPSRGSTLGMCFLALIYYQLTHHPSQPQGEPQVGCLCPLLPSMCALLVPQANSKHTVDHYQGIPADLQLGDILRFLRVRIWVSCLCFHAYIYWLWAHSDILIMIKCYWTHTRKYSRSYQDLRNKSHGLRWPIPQESVNLPHS